MKKLTMVALVAFLVVAYPAFAVDEHHPETPQATKPAAKDSQGAVKKMQDNVRKMEGQLSRLAKAKTDDDRHAAMFDYMRTMRENMALAHGMMEGMMDCPMMEGMAEKKGSMTMSGGGPSGGSADRVQQLEKRMDTMQMMMEQMQRRQEAQPAK